MKTDPERRAGITREKRLVAAGRTCTALAVAGAAVLTAMLAGCAAQRAGTGQDPGRLLCGADWNAVAGADSGALPGEVMRGGKLQAFIESSRCFPGLPRRAHRPDFRILPVEDRKYRGSFFWIADAEQKIGLLNLSFGEIEMFRFIPPPGDSHVEYTMPELHGWATLQGPRISIVPQGTWSGKGELARLPAAGSDSLRLRYREDLGTGGTLTHMFSLRFDEVLGYVWDCFFDLRSEKPARFEYTNLLPNGVADSRDGLKRFQKCVWTRRDGALCFMYQNPLSMMQPFGPEWTGTPDDGGFVGFVAEPDSNPFIEIVHSEPRTTFITCSVWYDQHVISGPPEQKTADGLYRISAAYRFLSLPLAVAKELEDAARTMLPASKDSGIMGFRQDVINDFEQPVPAGALFNGCIWGHSAKYDLTVGRSGARSLRLNGGESAGPVHGGPLLHVERGKRYRLSAWVRTRGAAGRGACLRMRNREESNVFLQSRSVAGDSDWTMLEIVFTPGQGDQFAFPGLAVEGPGTAWFDDIQLVELGR